MSHPPRSESPDEFLKREGLKGYDGYMAPKDPGPTIDKSLIQALRQPKDDTEKDCKDCS